MPVFPLCFGGLFNNIKLKYLDLPTVETAECTCVKIDFFKSGLVSDKYHPNPKQKIL